MWKIYLQPHIYVEVDFKVQTIIPSLNIKGDYPFWYRYLGSSGPRKLKYNLTDIQYCTTDLYNIFNSILSTYFKIVLYPPTVVNSRVQKVPWFSFKYNLHLKWIELAPVSFRWQVASCFCSPLQKLAMSWMRDFGSNR